MLFTDTDLLRHGHSLVQQQRDLPTPHQGTTFPSQSRKAPVSFSEREESTFSIPRTLASTVKGACGQKEKDSRVPEGWLRAAPEQTVAQGRGLSGASEEKPAQGEESSSSLISFPR